MEGGKRRLKSIQTAFHSPELRASSREPKSLQDPLWEGWNVLVRKRRLLRNQSCLLDHIPTEESWAVTCSASGRKGKRDLGLIQPQRVPGVREIPRETRPFTSNTWLCSLFWGILLRFRAKRTRNDMWRRLNHLNIGQELIYGALHGVLIQLRKIIFIVEF